MHPAPSDAATSAHPVRQCPETMGLRLAGNGLVRVIGPAAFGGLAAAGLPLVFVAAGALLGAVAAATGWRARRARGHEAPRPD